jgi:hypothetical protein
MERLPVELREQILHNLQIEDLKSIRLASTSWANLGASYLIGPKFISFPHRDDFKRLLSISEHPSMAPCVKILEFNMGEINEYHARHNIHFVQYLRVPEDRYEDGYNALSVCAELKKEKMAFQESYCKVDLMEAAFKNLTNLEVIRVNLTRCPSTNPLLERIWDIQSTRRIPRDEHCKKFCDILDAARHLKLRSLSHDWLPFEFWEKSSSRDNAAAVFKGLHTLKICLDCKSLSESSDVKSIIGFGLTLKFATQLHTLNLGFSNKFKEGETMKFADLIDHFTWPTLHTFGLESANVNEEDVIAFLERHKNTLKRLRLGVHTTNKGWNSGDTHYSDCSLYFVQGTLKGLLRRIGMGMKLDKLDMKGHVIDSDLATINFGSGIYNEDWDLVDDGGLKAKLGRASEGLALNGIEWKYSLRDGVAYL